jgi:hypothetical protein
MDAVEKAIFEIRRWAIEILQAKEKAKQPRVSREGTAALNREIINRLQSCHDIGVAPPEELIAVFAWQLNVIGRVRNEPRFKIQKMAAALALARDPELSDKQLARDCDVSRPTIALWKKQPLFDRLKAIFALDSILKEVFPWPQQELSHSPFPHERPRTKRTARR